MEADFHFSSRLTASPFRLHSTFTHCWPVHPSTQSSVHSSIHPSIYFLFWLLLLSGSHSSAKANPQHSKIMSWSTNSSLTCWHQAGRMHFMSCCWHHNQIWGPLSKMSHRTMRPTIMVTVNSMFHCPVCGELWPQVTVFILHYLF